MEQFVAWRKRNGLSQRAASEVIRARGLRISKSTIQDWEQAKRDPGEGWRYALETFIKQHPKIDNPPVYKSGPR
jgi:DNA-binding transcriptional regulator YiaG